MARKNYSSILEQLLKKLHLKLKKEQLILEQIKTINNPLQLLNQKQQICLIQSKIKNTKCYLEQLNNNQKQRSRSST